VTYLDTSALIKRFVTETGSRFVSLVVSRDRPVATAKLAYVELHAGLARRRRAGDLPSALYATACREFEADWPAYLQVELRDEILFLARDLVRRHPLRALDSIHLASAMSLRRALEEAVRFVAADERLLRAAGAEGLTAIDPERTTAD
jgi:predicted nucleic acid-binding protein